jgi:hypothetical protein
MNIKRKVSPAAPPPFHTAKWPKRKFFEPLEILMTSGNIWRTSRVQSQKINNYLYLYQMRNEGIFTALYSDLRTDTITVSCFMWLARGSKSPRNMAGWRKARTTSIDSGSFAINPFHPPPKIGPFNHEWIKSRETERIKVCACLATN